MTNTHLKYKETRQRGQCIPWLSQWMQYLPVGFDCAQFLAVPVAAAPEIPSVPGTEFFAAAQPSAVFSSSPQVPETVLFAVVWPQRQLLLLPAVLCCCSARS